MTLDSFGVGLPPLAIWQNAKKEGTRLLVDDDVLRGRGRVGVPLGVVIEGRPGAAPLARVRAAPAAALVLARRGRALGTEEPRPGALRPAARPVPGENKEFQSRILGVKAIFSNMIIGYSMSLFRLHFGGERGRKGRECKFQSKAHRTL